LGGRVYKVRSSDSLVQGFRHWFKSFDLNLYCAVINVFRGFLL
jgi:hypothetical protein